MSSSIKRKDTFLLIVAVSVVFVFLACVIALVSQWGTSQFAPVLIAALGIVPNLLLVIATARYVSINQESLEQVKQASDRMTPSPVIEVRGSKSHLRPGKPFEKSKYEFTFSVVVSLQISNSSPTAPNSVWIQNAKIEKQTSLRDKTAVFLDEHEDIVPILRIDQGETIIRSAEIRFGYSLSEDRLTTGQNTVVELQIGDSYGHSEAIYAPVKVNGET